MFREMREEDAEKLAYIDDDLPLKAARELGSTPGFFGIWDAAENFAVGIAVEDEIFLQKTYFCEAEVEDEIFRLLQIRFRRVHVDLSLNKADHGKILRLCNRGFQAVANGEMKVRMTLGESR